MPDSSQLPKPSTSIQLFDDSVKTTEQTALFSTDGARQLVVFQKATHVGTTTRTIFSEDLPGNADAMIDDSLDSASGNTAGSFTNTIIIDFGSIAVRTINTKGASSNTTNSSGGGSAGVSVSYSTTTSGFSGGGAVCTSGGTPSSQNNASGTRSDAGVNMRYAQVVVTGANNNGFTCTANCYECWDPTSGLGTSTLKFQIKNPDTGDWFDYVGTSEFTGQSSDAGSTDIVTIGENATKKYILPNNSTLVRAVLTPTYGVNTRVTVLRIYA